MSTTSRRTWIRPLRLHKRRYIPRDLRQVAGFQHTPLPKEHSIADQTEIGQLWSCPILPLAIRPKPRRVTRRPLHLPGRAVPATCPASRAQPPHPSAMARVFPRVIRSIYVPMRLPIAGTLRQSANDRPVAGALARSAPQSDGIPRPWLPYVDRPSP